MKRNVGRSGALRNAQEFPRTIRNGGLKRLQKHVHVSKLKETLYSITLKYVTDRSRMGSLLTGY